MEIVPFLSFIILFIISLYFIDIAVEKNKPYKKVIGIIIGILSIIMPVLVLFIFN